MIELKPVYKKVIDKIIKKNLTKKHLFCLMGSPEDNCLMISFLSFYCPIDVVLDNDERKEGTFQLNVPVTTPEKVLKPFNDSVYIIIINKPHHLSIIRQLQDLGYKKDQYIDLVKERSFIFGVIGYFKGILDLFLGSIIYRNLNKKYKKNVKIIILTCQTGDVFLALQRLRNWKEKENIENLVLTGDGKGLKKISRLFGYKNVEPLTNIQTDQLIRACLAFNYPNVKRAQPWSFEPYHTSVSRLNGNSKFIDSFNLSLSFNLSDKLDQIHFRNNITFKYNIVKNKTVIISPFAYSVRKLETFFWEKIFKDLKKRGYYVKFCLDKKTEYCSIRDAETIFFPYEDSEYVLKTSGHFIGIRSGLVDIISSIKCHKVILYPELPENEVLPKHHSDLYFTGFKAMGFDTEGVCEISSKAIIDTNYAYLENDTRNRFLELHNLYEKIISQFPNLN